MLDASSHPGYRRVTAASAIASCASVNPFDAPNILSSPPRARTILSISSMAAAPDGVTILTLEMSMSTIAGKSNALVDVRPQSQRCVGVEAHFRAVMSRLCLHRGDEMSSGGPTARWWDRSQP